MVPLSDGDPELISRGVSEALFLLSPDSVRTVRGSDTFEIEACGWGLRKDCGELGARQMFHGALRWNMSPLEDNNPVTTDCGGAWKIEVSRIWA